jgi:multicomponent Na+:H+ antiporter subunit G
MSIVSDLLLVAGVFFIGVTAVGLLRLPDFYSRVHAVSKTETLGLGLLLLGLVVHEGFSLLGFKLALILVFAVVTNPLAAHLLSRAAIRQGLQAWTNEAADNRLTSAPEA